MDHTTIDEHQVVERYVIGKLPEPELTHFERHYLSCPQCLDRLALAEAMERGFKRAAGEEAARLAMARQLSLVVWLSRLGRSRQAAVLAMALLVAVVLPGTLAWRERSERNRELREVRSALEQEQARSATGSRAAAEAEKLRSELDASRGELAREREARAGELAAARSPQANVPILFLSAERGGPAPGEPSFQLRLPRAPGWIVLAPEIDSPSHPSYHAVLRDVGGRELWSGAGLRPDDRDTLTLALPSTLFTPGDHTLIVEGITAGGKPVAAGRFTFRVLPPG